MYPGVSWDFYEQLASLSEFVDFGCEFADGMCRRMRVDKFNKHCCCETCYNNVGYQHNINLATVDVLAHLFEPVVGFFRPEKGCALPRKYRAATCVRYYCGYTHLESEVEKKYCNILYNIRWETFTPISDKVTQSSFLTNLERELKENYDNRQKQLLH